MKLILGTANFGGQYGHGASPSLAEIERILNVAADAGIEYIDTAPAYNCDYTYEGFKVIQKTPYQGKAWALLQHNPDGKPPARRKMQDPRWCRSYGFRSFGRSRSGPNMNSEKKQSF